MNTLTSLAPAAELSEEQQECERRIQDFLIDPYPAKPYFSVQGLAGCGKSWLLAKIARQMGGRGLMGAFTGKAASVLSRRTGLEASTIHSAIYQFERESWNDQGKRELEFSAKVENGSWRKRTFLLDESSMVPESLALDLIATGVKLITAGDPGQLQPVNGVPFFRDADFTLQEVRRQAWDSPIIRQAHRMRHEGQYGPDGADFRVERFVDRDDLLAADILLCWRNTTRRMLNDLVRAHRQMPVGYADAGEPVMALKNNHTQALLNGAIYTLRQPHRPGGAICVINERGDPVEVEGWVEGLEDGRDQDRWSIPFAFAYAATVHKSQGSSWPRIIVVDEYDQTEQRREWVYTALTRAEKSVIVQRNW